MDKQDYASEAISRCVGVEPAQAKKILNSELSPEVCLGHWIAGIRELFEEAGILLVYDKRGNIPDFNIRRVRKKIDGYRALIQQGKISMNEMMKKNDFRYAVDSWSIFPLGYSSGTAEAIRHSLFITVLQKLSALVFTLVK